MILQVKVEVNLDYRLPSNFKPSLYEIQLKPYIGTASLYGDNAFKFEGSVNISIMCLNATNKIVLHHKNMVINSVNVYQTRQNTLQSIQVVGFTYDPKLQFMTIQVDRNLVMNGLYVVSIDYTGEISDSLEGFYRSSYVDSDGNKQ
jgi:aminopeptidase N